MAETFNVPKDVQQTVLTKSWEDPEFAQLVQDDPRAALEQLGFSVTDDIDFNVVRQGNRTLTLLMADNPAGTPVSAQLAGGIKPEANWTSNGGGCGNTCTLTAECGCPTHGTLTCGCACGSILGC